MNRKDIFDRKTWTNIHDDNIILNDELKLFIRSVYGKENSEIKFLARLTNYEQDVNNVKINFEIFQKLNSVERKAVSLDNFIMRYGKIEGKKRHEEKRKKASTQNSIESIMKRKMCSEEEAINFKKEWNDKKDISTRKYLDSLTLYERKCISPLSKEYWIERKGYSEEDAIEASKEHQKKMQKNNNRTRPDSFYKSFSTTQKEYWIERKGYSEEDAIEAVKKSILGMSNSLEGFIIRHGEIEGKKKYKICNERRTNSIRKYRENHGDTTRKASKESLKVFLPIYDWLLQKNINDDNIYFGYKDKSEYFIANSNKYHYSFDFTIKDVNLMIEYNGTVWHPRMNKLTEAEKLSWNNPFKTEINAYTKHENDMQKYSKANERGFDVIEIWSDDDVNYNIELVKREIIKRMKI